VQNLLVVFSSKMTKDKCIKSMVMIQCDYLCNRIQVSIGILVSVVFCRSSYSRFSRILSEFPFYDKNQNLWTAHTQQVVDCPKEFLFEGRKPEDGPTHRPTAPV
jgi:hypothetical protein